MASEYVKKVFGITSDSNDTKKKRVKMRKYKNGGDEYRYVGIYNGKVYAISTVYDLVYDYMTTHRKLKNGEFSIEQKDCDDLMISANIECELVEYHGLYVADRDVIMSKLFMKEVGTEIKDIQISLISMARMIGQLGSETDTDNVKTLLKAFKVLESIKEDPLYVLNLEEIAELDNHFIYSDMETYRHLLSQYEFYLNSLCGHRFI